MENKTKIKLARFILFFSGITMGMSIARIYTYSIGVCPFGTTGIVVMILTSITLFILYIIMIDKKNNNLKEEIY